MSAFDRVANRHFVALGDHVQDIYPEVRHATLGQHLRERQQLLLLYNFERLLESGPPARLLSDCPQLKVRVTSRGVLRLQGEHKYEVPTLTLLPAGHRPSLEVYRHEGIHLFGSPLWGSRDAGPIP